MSETSDQERITDAAMRGIMPEWQEILARVGAFLEGARNLPPDEVKDGLDRLFDELPKDALSGKLEYGYLAAMLAGYGKNADSVAQ